MVISRQPPHQPRPLCWVQEVVDGKVMFIVSSLGIVMNLVLMRVFGHNHSHGGLGDEHADHGHSHGHDHEHGHAPLKSYEPPVPLSSSTAGMNELPAEPLILTPLRKPPLPAHSRALITASPARSRTPHPLNTHSTPTRDQHDVHRTDALCTLSRWIQRGTRSRSWTPRAAAWTRRAQPWWPYPGSSFIL